MQFTLLLLPCDPSFAGQTRDEEELPEIIVNQKSGGGGDGMANFFFFFFFCRCCYYVRTLKLDFQIYCNLLYSFFAREGRDASGVRWEKFFSIDFLINATKISWQEGQLQFFEWRKDDFCFPLWFSQMREIGRSAGGQKLIRTAVTEVGNSSIRKGGASLLTHVFISSKKNKKVVLGGIVKRRHEQT